MQTLPTGDTLIEGSNIIFQPLVHSGRDQEFGEDPVYELRVSAPSDCGPDPVILPISAAFP